jgi:hypothetical protein
MWDSMQWTARIKAAIETWISYGVNAGRRRLEALLNMLLAPKPQRE